MRGLLIAINRYTAAFGFRINASKTKVMSDLTVNSQGVKEIRSRFNLFGPQD